MGAFPHSHKYYELFLLDKIKKKINFHLYSSNRINEMNFLCSLVTPLDSPGLTKLRLLGGNSAAQERVRLYQRRAGKGVDTEEEAARREHQTTVGCDEQQNSNYRGDA